MFFPYFGADDLKGCRELGSSRGPQEGCPSRIRASLFQVRLLGSLVGSCTPRGF